MIPDGPTMILVAKAFDKKEAALYEIPLDPPAPIVRPARPRLIGRLSRFVEPVTGASVSSDGSRVAVCAGSVTRIYSKTPEQPWPLLSEVRYQAHPFEGIAWDGDDLILVAEGGPIARIPAHAWRVDRVIDGAAGGRR
jgi:hypothetical protein